MPERCFRSEKGDYTKIEDVFRKLKPIAEQDMDLLWQEYILADTKTRKSIEEALLIILAENLNETYEERSGFVA